MNIQGAIAYYEKGVIDRREAHIDLEVDLTPTEMRDLFAAFVLAGLDLSSVETASTAAKQAIQYANALMIEKDKRHTDLTTPVTPTIDESRPHEFVEQCLNCSRSKGEHTQDGVMRVGLPDHLFVAAGDCKLCSCLRNDEIHLGPASRYAADPSQRCKYPGCGNRADSLKHNRNYPNEFDHDFQVTDGDPACWCSMPKLSTTHHPVHGTHDFGQPLRPQKESL